MEKHIQIIHYYKGKGNNVQARVHSVFTILLSRDKITQSELLTYSYPI